MNSSRGEYCHMQRKHCLDKDVLSVPSPSRELEDATLEKTVTWTEDSTLMVAYLRNMTDPLKSP